jgi:hypothetical protein
MMAAQTVIPVFPCDDLKATLAFYNALGDQATREHFVQAAQATTLAEDERPESAKELARLRELSSDQADEPGEPR